MNQVAIHDIVVATLRMIAPEVEESELIADRPLRDQVDLDSMDWLNFLIGLHNALQIEIPESDYSKLGTLNELVAYVSERCTT